MVQRENSEKRMPQRKSNLTNTQRLGGRDGSFQSERVPGRGAKTAGARRGPRGEQFSLSGSALGPEQGCLARGTGQGSRLFPGRGRSHPPGRERRPRSAGAPEAPRRRHGRAAAAAAAGISLDIRLERPCFASSLYTCWGRKRRAGRRKAPEGLSWGVLCMDGPSL